MAKIEYMTNAFQSDLKPRARLVLNCLALHCNKESQCFPSIKTIARECGYSVNTVKRALDDLVTAGFITKEARFDTERKHGGQTSNLYTLNIIEPKKEESKSSKEDKKQSIQVNENSSVKKEQGAKREVCDNRELGVAHSVQDKSSVEISPDIAYPTYNFSWAGGQAKGASP
jgi:DNA-binding transcriptional regulator YhcF (GntR family)